MNKLIVLVFCVMSLNYVLAGTNIEVSSVAELEEALLTANPGDVVTLLEGHYEADKINIKATGTKERPITIVAEAPEKVFIEGKMVVSGNYLTIKNLFFIKKGQLELLGKGHRVTKCIWDDSEAGKWMRVLPGSIQIEIDHNVFKNKEKSNRTLEKGCQLLQVLVRNDNERHHIHHNLFKDIARGKTDNGFEVIQLREEFNAFEPGNPYCNSVVENNLFVRCFGESEIISVKSNGNVIRNNTFRASRGGLVLRHGEGSIVSGNYFLGEGEESSGGIRIAGFDHIISNNYMQDLGEYGLAMMDGTPDGLYVRVENVTVQFNTFVNCANYFVIGLNHAKHPNGTVPRTCKIIGNALYLNKKSGPDSVVDLVQNDQPEDWTVQSNIVFGKKINGVDGFLYKRTGLTINSEQLFVPTEKTDRIDAAEIKFEPLKTDLFGQTYSGNFVTVGAIQYPIAKEMVLPLTEDSVLKQ